jgi:uncharacterized protein (TIGR03118 family)
MVSVHLFGKERPKELSDTINSLSRIHRPVRPCHEQVPHRFGIAPALGLRAGGMTASCTADRCLSRGGSTMETRIGNRRSTSPHPKKTRLEVERLEDRTLLSAGYVQFNLVGFQPGMARFTDPNLNGWGLAFAPNGPFWVADTATGVSTVYNHQGMPLPLVVSIPGGLTTGTVYNPTSDFPITANGKTAPALFIFDSIAGIISGWNPAVDPTHAIAMVSDSTAGFFGIDIGKNSSGKNVLYAADGFHNRIDMFDGNLNSLGSFSNAASVDAQYPGYLTYNVEDVNGRLFVTYVSFGAPPFGGIVDVFDTDGNLLTPNHFAANAAGAGPLENPWGITQAPANFGIFSNDLLIGNVEGAGHINAFDPSTGAFLGQLAKPDGTPIAIPGLWDLAFGAGSPANGKTNELFFTAGPNAVTFTGNGMFGEIIAAGDQSGSAAGSAAVPVILTLGQGGNSSSSGAVLGSPQGYAVSISAPAPAAQGSAPATTTPPALNREAPGSLPTRVLDQLYADLDRSRLSVALEWPSWGA